ncbi:MAG: aminoglycoside phosphotransferase family protein [Alphaproteobacteria bacterium]|nr:aminoglycoside phosphotransferase family protein [Alphaproteobacteria bacterium]
MSTKEKAFKFLFDNFPGMKISFFGEGWTSVAFLVGDYIFRFAKEPEYLEKYKTAAKVISLVRPSLDIPISGITIVEGQDLIYTSHHYLRGNHWSQDEFAKLPADKQDAFVSDCARFLYKMHSMKIDPFTNDKSGKKPKTPNVVPFDVLENLMDGRIPKEDLKKIYKKYEDIAGLPANGDKVLLHGDFKGTNAVVNDDYRLIGVFDFENAKVGERASEFKYFYSPKNSMFLEKLLAEYKKLSGIEIDVQRLRDLCLRDCINGMKNIGRESLDDIRKSALDSRAERLLRFV